MKKLLLAFALAGTYCPAAVAAPITLICTGTLGFPGNSSTINSETAILDLDANTFKPPLYSAYSLIKVSDTEVTFGLDNPTRSIWGSLDRVSGSLVMNVMTPEDRRHIQSGLGGKMMAWIEAKCAPAKRMF